MPPPPDKTYISNAYSALKDNLDGFNKSPEEFERLMTSDADYRMRAYTALKENLDGFTKSTAEFDKAVLGDIPEPISKDKQDMFAMLTGRGDKPVTGDIASLPRVTPDTKVEKLYEALPAMKAKKVRDITTSNLMSQGKIGVEGKPVKAVERVQSDDYNREKQNVEKGLRDEDWMPSIFLGNNKEGVKKAAVDKFAAANKEDNQKVQDKLDSGDYILEDGKVKVKGDFLDNLQQGAKDFLKNIGLALNVAGAQANKNTDAEASNEIKYHMNEFFKDKANDKEYAATDLPGQAGKLLGGIAPYTIPYADIPLMGLSNLGANHQEIWGDPSLSDDQKARAIINTSNDAFMIGAGQAVAFSSLHAGEPQLSAKQLLSQYAPTSNLKQKFAQGLYDNYKELLKPVGKDLAAAASVGAGTELLNSLNKAKEGVNVDFKKIPEAALEMATLDLVMKAPKVLTSAFSTIREARRSGLDKTDPRWFNQYSKQTQDALNNIVSAPDAVYKSAIAQLDNSPDVNAATAKQKIETFRNYYNSLPADLLQEAKSKALHILQLKTEAMDDMRNSSDPTIRKTHETRALAYDGLLQKVISGKDVDTKKEPLLISRFAAPPPPPKDEQQVEPQEKPNPERDKLIKEQKILSKNPEVFKGRLSEIEQELKGETPTTQPADEPKPEPPAKSKIEDIPDIADDLKRAKAGGIPIEQELQEAIDFQKEHKAKFPTEENVKYRDGKIKEYQDKLDAVNKINGEDKTGATTSEAPTAPQENQTLPGNESAAPKETATEVPAETATTVESPKVKTENAQSNTNENIVPEGTQNEPSVKAETGSDAEKKISNRRVEASSSWLEAIERGDSEKVSHFAEELFGKAPTQKAEGSAELLADKDGGRTALRASGDNGGDAGQKTSEDGTRTSQEQEHLRQLGVELGIDDGIGTLKASQQGDVARADSPIIPGGKITRGEVVEKVRQLFNVRDDAEKAQIAGSLRSLLGDAKTQEEKDFITKNIEYRALQKSTSKSVLQREPKEAGSTGSERGGVEQVKQGDEAAGESGQAAPSPKDGAGDGKKKKVDKPLSDTQKAHRLDEITEPRDLVMQYFIAGGKVHTSALLKIFGRKKAFGEEETHYEKGEYPEQEKRKRIGLIGKNAPTLARLADNLGDADPSGKYNSRDYQNAIEEVLTNYNSTGKMATDLVRRYEQTSFEDEFTKEEFDSFEKDHFDKRAAEVEGLAPDVKKELINLLSDYQDKMGYIDWEKLQEDSDGFDPKMLSLSDGAAKSLEEILDKRKPGQGEPDGTANENAAGKGQEAAAEAPSKSYELDGNKIFFHASSKERVGRLKKGMAPQFGEGVYFSTNKDLVVNEFGDKVTEAELTIDNPVYTNTKEWTEIEKEAIRMADEAYGKRKGLTLGEDDTYHRYDPENLSEIDEIDAKHISNAAKKLGYDAIIDKGSRTYENEIIVLDDNKIIYPEDKLTQPITNKAEVSEEIERNLFNESAQTIAEKKKKLQSKIQEAITKGIKKWGSKKEEQGYYDGSQSEKMIDVPNLSFSDERGKEGFFRDDKFEPNPKYDPSYHKDLLELDHLKHDMDNVNDLQELHKEDYAYTDNSELKKRLGSLVFSFGGSDAKRVRDAFEANKIIEHLTAEGEKVDVDKIITQYKDADASEGQIQKFKNNAAEITAIIDNKGVDAPSTQPITNKEKAKAIAAKWDEVADNIGNFKFGEGAMMDISAIPRQVIRLAIKGAARLIEAGGSIADAVEHVVDELKKYHQENNLDYKGAEIKKAANDLLKTVGLIPGEHKVTKKGIMDAASSKITGDKIVLSQKEALKKQIRDFARGFGEGRKAGVDEGIVAGVKAGVKRGAEIMKAAQEGFARDISKYLKEATFGGKLTEAQAKAIARKAASVGGNANKMIDFVEYAEKVIDDVQYAEKFDSAKQLQKKLAKYLSSDKKFTNNVDILRTLKRLPLNKLSPAHLDEFIRMATEYRNAQRSPTDQAYLPFDTTKNKAALEKIQKQLEIDADNSLIAKAEEASGVLFLSVEEARTMLDALAASDVDEFFDKLGVRHKVEGTFSLSPGDPTELAEFKQKQLRNSLERRAAYSQMAIRLSLSDSDYLDQVHPRAQVILKRVADADLSVLNNKNLVELIKGIDNALLNGTSANIGRLDAMVQAKEAVAPLTAITSKNKIFDLNIFQTAFEDLPVLMKAMYGLTKTVAEFRRQTGWDKVFNGGAKAKKALLDKLKSFDNFLKSNNISKEPDDVFRRGMYGHAIQHEGGTPEEINRRLSNNKALIEQSIAAYKEDKGTRKMGEQLEAIYNADVKPFDKMDDLMNHFATTHPDAVKAHGYWEDAFAGLKDDLKFVTEAYHNKFFEGETINFTPRGYNFIDRELNHPPGEPVMSFNNYVGKPPQNANSITRVVEKKLPAGMALDFNFDYQMLKSFKKAQYDIHTTEGQFVFSEFMKAPESKEIVGGANNKKIIKEQYQKAEQVQSGLQVDDDIAAGIIKGVADTIRNVSSTAALGGVTAYPKQYFSVAVKTLGTLGSDAGLFFDVQKVKLKDLGILEQTAITLRGEQRGGTNTGSKDDVLRSRENILNNVIQKGYQGVSQWLTKNRARAMKSLEEGDVRVAKRSFLAYYMKYMKDQGVNVTVNDLYTEHTKLDETREKALAYAQQMVDESQLVSNSAMMSDFKRPTGNFYKNFVKTILLPFNSFASNTRTRMIEDGKFIFIGDGEQRREAWRDALTSVSEVLVYQGINTLLLTALIKYPAHEIFDYLFGVGDSDPKTFKDRMMMEWKKFYSNSLKDTLVSGLGNNIETGLLEGLNQIGWYLHSVSSPEDKTPKHEWLIKNAWFFAYDKANPTWIDRAGTFGVWINEAQQTGQDIKGAASGKIKADNSYVNEASVDDGDQSIDQITGLHKTVPLTIQEQRFMFFQTLLDLTFFAGLSDADLKRLADAKKREILAKESKLTKTKRSLYRALRQGR